VRYQEWLEAATECSQASEAEFESGTQQMRTGVYTTEGDIPGTQQMRTGVVPERTWYSTYTATGSDGSNTGHSKYKAHCSTRRQKEYAVLENKAYRTIRVQTMIS
jgi:hypothetical protein